MGKRRQESRLAALLVIGAVVAAAGLALLPSGRSGASASVVSVESSVVTAGVSTTPSTNAGFSNDTTTYSPVSTEPTSSTTATATLHQHPLKHPARIVIPAMNLDATVIEVGLLENGDMEVPPFGLVGWYNQGPVPGASGPAVIVGHVDTKSGPDVFYHLKDLEPGDELLLYGEDGDLATFVADSKEQQLKSELPVEKIWSDTQEPVIRLITCGGDFDRRSRHYLSNVIVYGHLVN